MPEGHTVHGYARRMAELIGHEVTGSSPQGKFDVVPIDGATISAVEAYGKHLLVDTDADLSMHVHLGMRGKWLRFAPVTGPGLPQVRLRLALPDLAWDLIAPSRCELLDPDARTRLVQSLGPDPLRPDADPDLAYRNLSSSRLPIGPALMDQSVIAGIGNVFRAEILHACRIAPDRPSNLLTRPEFDRLWTTLQTIMFRAVTDGRIITVDAEDRLTVPEALSRRVYKRDHCADCGTPVVITELAGRTSHACPHCQPG